MTNLHSCRIATLCVLICACAIESVEETSTREQAGMNMQGMNMQGMNMQGMNMQGMNMQGFQLGGATLSGVDLVNLRVEKGEVIAERDQVTLRGAALAGARLLARVQDPGANPPATAVVEYRIAGVVPEDPKHDPTHTGATFLYTLEQWIPEEGAWHPACPVDADGRRAAIPIAATWDARGDRIESSELFTFGCTTGVLAKCYRWGYRPWLTGYGGADLAEMHWTCTRLARADYCGNGVSHTREGTKINVWDRLPAPGPIQKHAGLLPTLGMLFEAGWTTSGAACVSHTRWLLDGGVLLAMCPDRLILPGLGPLLCSTQLEALLFNPEVKLFNQSYLLDLGL